MSQAQIEDGNSNSGSESRSRSLVSQPADERTASHTKEERIDSFETCPPGSPVNPIRLAKAGFYFEPSNNFKYRVVCAGCSHVVNSWNSNDVPSDQRFHEPGCEFANILSGSQEGRSGIGVVKALVGGEEATITKPLVVARNLPHLSLQNIYGHQQSAEEFSTSVQRLSGRRDFHGRQVGLSMPAVVTRHTRMHRYHDPETGHGQQTYEQVETTSSQGRNVDEEVESPIEDIYASAYPNEQRTPGSASIQPSFSHFIHPEDETLRSQPTTYESRYTSRLENSQDLQTFLTGLDMRIGDNRLHTFQELWDDRIPFRNTRLLVICGFYCIGQGDAVKCFHCGVVLANWSRNDNPRQRHEEMSPDCHFLINPDETGEQPLSIQSRSSRLTTATRSSSYAPTSYLGSNVGMGSFNSLPHHHQQGRSREASLSPRRDLYTNSSFYPQSPRRGTQYPSQHNILMPPSHRGQTSLYHGSASPSSHSPHSSHHSRNSSISPHRGGTGSSHSRDGRSPGSRMSYLLSPRASPHRSRHSSHSPVYQRHPSLISHPSVEAQPSNVTPEIYQPIERSGPPSPRPQAAPQQRNDPMLLYPCLNPRRPDMRDVHDRQRTFQPPYPRLSRLNLSYHDMAEAGFFYTGQWDRVACWYCGGGLENFEPNDEIWTEHAKYYPHCEYLLQRRGQQFVNDVARQNPIQRPVPVDQLPSVESNPGSLPPPPAYNQQELRQRREDIFNEGLQSQQSQSARELGYSEDLIRQVQWRNVFNHGVCYQTNEALINALIDATDAENISRTNADMQQEQPALNNVSQPTVRQPTVQQPTVRQATTSTNRQQQQNTQANQNGIVIEGVPMDQFMTDVFDTPFFRGELDHVFDSNETTVINGNAIGLPIITGNLFPRITGNVVPNITVRRSRVVNNTRRQPQATASQPRNSQTPTATNMVPPPQHAPPQDAEIPGMPQPGNTGATNEGGATESRNDRLERLEREKLCKICFTNDSNILFQPCGHICSCNDCSDRTTTCPVCRAPIECKAFTYRS